MADYIINPALEKLIEQYKSHDRLIIAYDFDDTVHPTTEYAADYVRIQSLVRMSKELLNAYLIVYTNNPDIDKIKHFLDKEKIPYDAINKNAPFGPQNEGKIYYNLLLDDKAGLSTTADNLNTLCQLVLNKKIKKKKAMPDFNARKVAKDLIQFIKDWFSENGSPKTKAIIGISGGKDSTVAAALCKIALGEDRVLGVSLPDGKEDPDVDQVAFKIGIPIACLNISEIKNLFLNCMANVSEQTMINLPARLRMTALYAFAQNLPEGGRVIETCNLSENYIGYFTRWGDGAGDVSLFADLTSDEVIKIGRAIGVPEELLIKPPADGLCGKTDEEKFGFSYKFLNYYIRTGEALEEDTGAEEVIKDLHECYLFKQNPIPKFKYEGSVFE